MCFFLLLVFFYLEILGVVVTRAVRSNYSNVVAAIVEHRPLKNLPTVFENFLTVLPGDVQIYFFCSPDSSNKIHFKLGEAPFEKERIIFIENYFGRLESVSVMSKKIYNRLILDHGLWNLFHNAQKAVVLLFEHDSFLCENPSNSLQSFIQFGYIGAPWLSRSCKTCKTKRIKHAKSRKFLPIPVGNSGLSIMSTELMLKVTSTFVRKRTQRLAAATLLRGGCDVYLSAVLQDKRFTSYFMNFSVAPVHMAKLFSAESLLDFSYTPFGGHGPCTFANELKNNCPQAMKACHMLSLN